MLAWLLTNMRVKVYTISDKSGPRFTLSAPNPGYVIGLDLIAVPSHWTTLPSTWAIFLASVVGIESVLSFII